MTHWPVVAGVNRITALRSPRDSTYSDRRDVPARGGTMRARTKAAVVAVSAAALASFGTLALPAGAQDGDINIDARCAGSSLDSLIDFVGTVTPITLPDGTVVIPDLSQSADVNQSIDCSTTNNAAPAPAPTPGTVTVVPVGSAVAAPRVTSAPSFTG